MLHFLTSLQIMFSERIDRDDEGATMVEYGLLVALIAVVVAVAAAALGTRISTMFNGLVFP